MADVSNSSIEIVSSNETISERALNIAKHGRSNALDYLYLRSLEKLLIELEAKDMDVVGEIVVTIKLECTARKNST